MNPKLPFVLILLFLTACASRSVRDDSPASDLDALVSSVSRDLQPRTLQNGKEYCAELARTQRQQDACTAELEDVVFVSNRDKERAMKTLGIGVERLRLARAPCKIFDFACRKRARALDKDRPTNGS